MCLSQRPVLRHSSIVLLGPWSAPFLALGVWPFRWSHPFLLRGGFRLPGTGSAAVLDVSNDWIYSPPSLCPPPPNTFFFLCTSMSVGFQADRSALGLNESLGLTVVARNDSSASVRAMHIDIMQETTWYARGAKASNTRSIASIVLPGSELAPVEVGSKRGQSDASIEDKAREDLRGQLAAGAGTRYEILVPGDASTTLQSENIEVRHLLTVRLDTPTCFDSPDVWTPLRVQPQTVSMAAASALAQTSAADAAPVSDIPPVKVPQTAVNLVYSNELPPYPGPGKNSRT